MAAPASLPCSALLALQHIQTGRKEKATYFKLTDTADLLCPSGVLFLRCDKTAACICGEKKTHLHFKNAQRNVAKLHKLLVWQRYIPLFFLVFAAKRSALSHWITEHVYVQHQK